MDANTIDPAREKAPVAPEASPGTADAAPRPAPAISADAGTDESIAQRLERNPASRDARLDRALDESMDASDPPATTQPVHSHGGDDLPESSGYDPRAEARRARGAAEPGLIGRIAQKLGLG